MAQLARCPIYPVRIEGVRGQGLVVTSALLRSRARLTGYPPLFCGDDLAADCLESVAARLRPGS